MLSRSNTTASDRLRRTRSTASMQAARQRSSATSDPYVVRQQAEAAATQAYRRAQPTEQMACPDYRPAPPGLHRRRSQVTGRSEGSHLEDARLGRRRSTARRDEIKSTPAAGPKIRMGDASLPTKEVDARSRRTSAVQTETEIKSAHRKTRFVAAPSDFHLKPPSTTSGNRSSPARSSSAVSGVRGSSLAPTPRHTERSYDDGISVTYTEPQSYADRIKAECDFHSRRVSIRETQTDEEIIALARDRQLNDFKQPKLRERKSFFGSFQKLQRKESSDQNHNGGITYDSSLPPFNYADDSLVAPLPPAHDMSPPIVYTEGASRAERKTRMFSGSMKTQFKKLLRKASRAPSGLLTQRTEIEHHKFSLVDKEVVPALQPSAVLSDPFVVHDPLASFGHQTIPLFNNSRIGSDTSISGDSTANRSRVTSWTNSTAVGTSSTFANTASTSVADEQGRLKRSNSHSTLRKKSSFFGRAVQNRLRKSSCADLKGSEDSQALFAALRERMLPHDADGEIEHIESTASVASRNSSALSMLPSRRRAESLAPSGHRGTSTIRTVSPDPDAFKLMSPVVEVSPDRIVAGDGSLDQTPTANYYASKRRAAPVQADPPSPERIARRVRQSQARWQGALHDTSTAPDGKIGSAYDEENPYELPSLSRRLDQHEDTDTGGLPQHAKISAPAPTRRIRERLLSPSLYSRATDGASPRPMTPEEGGTIVTITSREVKRYEISPPKKQEAQNQRPIQASNEWRKWLSDEMNNLTEPEGAGTFNLPNDPSPAAVTTALNPLSRDRSATTGSDSQRYGSDTATSDQASKGRRGSRPRANSRRSSYMNDRYPTIESSDNSSRRTSRKYSMASNAGTDTERSLQNPASDDSKLSTEVTKPTNKPHATKFLPKRHSLAHLESSTQSKAVSASAATAPSASDKLTMSGAIPTQDPAHHLRPPTQHKHNSAFDLRIKYKPSTNSTSRPLEVRRKKSKTTPLAIFEDATLQIISAGPYASNPPAVTGGNKENTPPHHADDGSLPALSSSEWLAGPASKKRDLATRPKSSPPKAGGLIESGREGSPGQRLVTGWLEGRKGRGGDGEGAFV